MDLMNMVLEQKRAINVEDANVSMVPHTFSVKHPRVHTPGTATCLLPRAVLF